MSSTTPWPYSGARQSPRPVSRPQTELRDWAARPKRLRRRDGTVIEVYCIGALALALGKSSFTLRRWERLGHLPPTPLLQRVTGGPPRRLFTAAQIQGLVMIAEQEGLAGRKPACIAETHFTLRVTELYRNLFLEGF